MLNLLDSKRLNCRTLGEVIFVLHYALVNTDSPKAEGVPVCMDVP